MNELRVNELFDMEPVESAMRHLLRPWRAEGLERAPQIKVDMNETEENYLIKAEIPGVNKQDIDIRIENNRVTIRAEVKKEKEEKKNGRVLRCERQYGFASRSFALDSNVDEAHALARYQNGVLELTLPKKSTSTQRRLVIE